MAVDPPPSKPSVFPTFTNTPYGIFARLPLIQASSRQIAVLFCSIDGDPLGLVLTPCPDGVDAELPLYHTASPEIRLVRIKNLMRSHTITPQGSKNIYFAHRPSASLDPLPRSVALINGCLHPPFRIPHNHIRALAAEQKVRLVRATDVPFPWNGSQPMALVFENAAVGRKYFWIVTLGRCTGQASASGAAMQGEDSGTNTSPPGAHWATIQQCSYQYNPLPGGPPSPAHSCATDHIDEWPDLTKTFRAYYPGWIPVQLSFTPFLMNSAGETLVLTINFHPLTPLPLR